MWLSAASVTLDLHEVKSDLGHPVHQSLTLTPDGPTVAGLVILWSGAILGRASLSQQPMLKSRKRLQWVVFTQRLDEQALLPDPDESSLRTKQKGMVTVKPVTSMKRESTVWCRLDVFCDQWWQCDIVWQLCTGGAVDHSFDEHNQSHILRCQVVHFIRVSIQKVSQTLVLSSWELPSFFDRFHQGHNQVHTLFFDTHEINFSVGVVDFKLNFFLIRNQRAITYLLLNLTFFFFF